MNSWEWSQWCLALLVVGNLVLAAHQHGQNRRVSRGVIASAVAIVATGALLSVTGFW